MGFEVYQDRAGEWRWRLRAKNGQIVANGGEAFASKGNVLRSIKAVRKAVARAGDPVVVDEDDVPKARRR
jgi:uncharacterized protein YegP (UPF0339 family)